MVGALGLGAVAWGPARRVSGPASAAAAAVAAGGEEEGAAEEEAAGAEVAEVAGGGAEDEPAGAHELGASLENLVVVGVESMEEGEVEPRHEKAHALWHQCWCCCLFDSAETDRGLPD
mmetsp:Transcript_43278/g.93298  ORF Transcript_43278/g.93298 Transcript_43278/m.93298 type:complete len:118 (-) Transcript_43278:632-985(-)